MVALSDRPVIPDSRPSLFSELSTPFEMAQLLMDPVYYGVGVPRGDGSPVMLIPGFLASDLYLLPLQGWLRRIGYQAYESTLAQNVGCPNRLGRRLARRVEQIARAGGCKVTLIGHSKGGLLARGIAALRPDLVSQVIALGSPFAGEMQVHPLTERLLALAREGTRPYVEPEFRQTCYTGGCGCEMVRGFRGPFPAEVPFTSIYSRGDGVVVWQSCLDVVEANNLEVAGSHCGLAFNSQVFRHLAKILARHPASPLC